MSKKKSRVGLGTALGLGAAVLAIGGFASAKGTGGGGGSGGSGGSGSGGSGGSGGGRGSSGGSSGGNGSGSGGSGGSGSGGSGGTPTAGPGGAGVVYGDPSKVPDVFDFGGNHLWISPDCDVVAEARYFRPNDDFMVSAIEPTEYPAYVAGDEVEAVLLVDRENTIAGYIDWAMTNGLPPLPSKVREWIESRADATYGVPPIPAAMALAAEVLRQISPLCMEGSDPTEHWGPGLSTFMADFMKWIESYLIEWDMIDFHPDAPKPEPAVG